MSHSGPGAAGLADGLPADRSGLFNPAATLRCLGCGQAASMGPHWTGCDACGLPLVVEYRRGQDGEALPLGERLPIRPDRLPHNANAPTPLIRLPVLDGTVLGKFEGFNRSGSHKDRFQRVAVSIAAGLGYDGVVVRSTGNHGAAAAAHAAALGLSAVVLLHPDSPQAVQTQLAIYGAEVAVVQEDARSIMAGLVERGFCPCTSADPALAGFGNPYGQEGYKQIAYEIVDALGSPPAAVAIPAASGDTVYGIWRGFRDLHELYELPMPRLLGCQPEGAAPLAAGAGPVTAGVRPIIEHPTSGALSTRDAQTGWHASYVLEQDGMVVTLSEGEIADELRHLGRAGHITEPASALGIAAIRKLMLSGELGRDEPAVAVLTSSGLNWTAHIRSMLSLPSPSRSREKLVDRLSGAGDRSPTGGADADRS